MKQVTMEQQATTMLKRTDIKHQKYDLRGASRPFDFHIHSRMSDGTDEPRELVHIAKASGVLMMAITDHDTVNGAEQAKAEGDAVGLCVISGVELDTQFDCELHIIGLGIDTQNERLKEMLNNASKFRKCRNQEIIRRLETMGISVLEHIGYVDGTLTRLHIAKAIIACGWADTLNEAFAKFLDKGAPAYVFAEKTDRRSAIETIHTAGGVAVLAHPCKLKCDYQTLIRELADMGIDALEAYYPNTSQGHINTFTSLASQYGLHISTGSDYHGANRKNVSIGCAYRDIEALNEFGAIIKDRYAAL